MTDEELTQKELDELTKARKPSTQKELTEKARRYIMEQAEIANGGPLTKKTDS